MDRYCLVQLLEGDEAIEVEPQPARSLLRVDDTYCWVCGADIIDMHCKIVCKRCGFMRDCSDP